MNLFRVSTFLFIALAFSAESGSAIHFRNNQFNIVITEPDDLKGVLRLKIGTPLEEVSDLLEKKGRIGYFERKMIQAFPEKSNRMYESWRAPISYRVKNSAVEYFNLFGRPVKFIEVKEKYSKIEEVNFFLEKGYENFNVIKSGMDKKFGNSFCVEDSITESRSCSWMEKESKEYEGYECELYNSKNDYNIIDFDEYVFVTFKGGLL